MNYDREFGKGVLVLGIIVIAWAGIFLLTGRISEQFPRDLWGLAVIGSALITFFGFLRLPGCVDENGASSESRIRLAISGALIVAYFVYFGSVIYLDKGQETFATDVFLTLTDLLKITIPFYFGSTAAVEIAGAVSNKNGSK